MRILSMIMWAPFVQFYCKKWSFIICSFLVLQPTLVQAQPASSDIKTIQLLMTQQKYHQAKVLVEELLEKEPQSLPLLLLREELEGYLGAWREPIDTQQPFEALPDAADFASPNTLKSPLSPPPPTYARIENYYRTNNKINTEFNSALELENINFSPFLRGGVSLKRERVLFPLIQRAGTGVTSLFKGERYSGQLDAIYDKSEGSKVKGSVYSNLKTVGGGVEYRQATFLYKALGENIVNAEFQNPYWGLIESVVDYGVRDTLMASRKQDLSRAFEGLIGVGYHNYGINLKRNQARSFAWRLRLSYKADLPGRNAGSAEPSIFSDTNLSLSYSLDGESPFQVVQRPTQWGWLYRPLALQRMQKHTLGLLFNKALNSFPGIRLEGLAEYSYNPFLGRGPAARGNIYFPVAATCDLQLFAVYARVRDYKKNKSNALTSLGRCDTVKTVGVLLTWRL
jgi:hypothetical protein